MINMSDDEELSDIDMSEYEPRDIIFKARNWTYEELNGNGALIIHVSGITDNNETIQVQVHNFKPHVYLEIPSRFRLDSNRAEMIYKYMRNNMTHKPVSYEMVTDRKNIYYSKKMQLIKIHFMNQSGCDSAFKFFLYKIHKILGVRFEQGELKIHEHKLDPIIKFITVQNVKAANWCRVRETILKKNETDSIEERKFSTADVDLHCHWRDFFPYDNEDTIVYEKYCSFDIECYSKNHNSKIPDPSIKENVVFQISMVFGRIDKEEKSIHLLSLFNPHDMPGVKIHRYDSEKKLLLGFSMLVRKYDPDVFLGFNHIKFDWNYMIERSSLFGYQPIFMKMSRLIGRIAEVEKNEWRSNAYGHQKFKYPNCHGRFNIDIHSDIEQKYKLSKYTLDFISKKFLNDSKDDINARQLFMLFQITSELLHLVEDRLVSNVFLKKIKRRIKSIFILRKTHGVVREYRSELLNATRYDIEDILRKAMTLTGKYCVQDTILPIRLCKKLNLIVSMDQMSNVTHVPVSYLHTRGQQIKVLSQVYRSAYNNGFIIPTIAKKDDGKSYQGATVFEANEGFYVYVGTLDFKSLYPTIIIAYNICYTTILEDDDPTPDEYCHVLEWEEHVGCEHDKIKRKSKVDKKKIICSSHRYRFRKVEIEYDSDGNIIYKNEGIMPQMERNLLNCRALLKVELFRMQARLAMHRGEATESDIKYYIKKNIAIISPGSLGSNEEKMLEILIGIKDAGQLAVKVACNSGYGVLGARVGYIPFIPGAASVTSMGRRLIFKSVQRIKERWDNVMLVYGDTDSCMIHFKGCSVIESFNRCKEASVLATHYLKSEIIGLDENFKIQGKYRLDKITSKSPEFKKLSLSEKKLILLYEYIPIDLEFENMYGEFLLLTKKRYIAIPINEEGEPIGKRVEKGIVLKRRDNSAFLKLCYSNIIDEIFNNDACRYDIINIVVEYIKKLYTRQITDEELIIYMGVKDLIEYAVTKEITKQIRNGKNITTQKVKVFIDEEGDSFETDNCDDPRLKFRDIPQVLLLKKLRSRGEVVPPNTRLEYIYIDDPKAIKQGHKAEDYVFYKEYKHFYNLKPDYHHYIEKQLDRPISEILNIKFKIDEYIAYEKLDDKVNRLIKTNVVSSLKIQRLDSIKKYRKFTIPEDDLDDADDEYIHIKNEPPPLNHVYHYKGLCAKVQYILDSSKNMGPNDFSEDDPLEFELIEACKEYKARYILDKIYSLFGMKKRPRHSPKQRGEQLKEETQVIILTDDYSVPKYSKGFVVDTLLDEESSTKSKKYYYHTLNFDGLEIGYVPRKNISPIFYKDNNVIMDLYNYRVSYSEVVEQLKFIFSPYILDNEPI